LRLIYPLGYILKKERGAYTLTGIFLWVSNTMHLALDSLRIRAADNAQLFALLRFCGAAKGRLKYSLKHPHA
jgi:hypothetical protein